MCMCLYRTYVYVLCLCICYASPPYGSRGRSSSGSNTYIILYQSDACVCILNVCVCVCVYAYVMRPLPARSHKDTFLTWGTCKPQSYTGPKENTRHSGTPFVCIQTHFWHDTHANHRATQVPRRIWAQQNASCSSCFVYLGLSRVCSASFLFLNSTPDCTIFQRTWRCVGMCVCVFDVCMYVYVYL